MKRFLQFKSNRWGHDGWALKSTNSTEPMAWTTCTTREECRELRQELYSQSDLFQKLKIVKVKISIEMTAQ